MLLKIGESIYRWALVALCSLMFIIVGTNVFFRYILNSSLGWADELSRFIFIWISFLGAVVAYQNNEHVGLDFVVAKITSPVLRSLIRLLGRVCILVVLVSLAYNGWLVAISSSSVSPALYIPMTYVYGVVPFSALLMCIICLIKIKGDIVSLAKH